jgi:hypothetical protein
MADETLEALTDSAEPNIGKAGGGGSDKLNDPKLNAKLQRYYQPHIHTENQMDAWRKEDEQKQKKKRRHAK